MSRTPEQSLFESYFVPVLHTAYGTALYLAGNPKDAEELVQEAAVTAFSEFHSFRPGMNFRVWFLRILTSRFAACGRRPDTVAPFGAPAAASGDRNNPWTPHADPLPADLFRNLDEQQIADAFARLPEEDRTVCALYFTGEFHYAEIAQVVGHPTETVRERLHQGRKRLQNLLRAAIDPGRDRAAPGLPAGASVWSRPEAALSTC